MEIEFFGAAGEVTGSCHILRVGNTTLLLDCGMIQGGRNSEERNAEPFPFRAADIDAVVLSHAHLDHSGRLPLLVKRGFEGPIHTHNASKDLAAVLLADSAHLQRSIVRRANRWRAKKDKPLLTELYSGEDADQTLAQTRGHRYASWIKVADNVRARFHDAGHIMGSAIVELELSEQGLTKTLVFSGDLGEYDTPILEDPSVLERADLVLMESTYGGRAHRSRADTLVELGGILRAAAKEGGNLLIPAFAVGRSQELLYQFGKHFDEWNMQGWEIYLDSPMAIKTTEIYWRYPHLYDEEATKLSLTMNPMPSLPNLRMSRSAEDSKRLKKKTSGCIFIAGSGMCNGGRILHHFRNNLHLPKTRVLFTGYQAPHSLGRRIIDGADEVRIHGKPCEVKAKVATVGGFSAHGDADDLSRWYKGFTNTPPLFLVHGDPKAGAALRDQFEREHNAQVALAEPGLKLDLGTLG